MKPLTVLSLFDGISCGRVALKRANIPVAKYYASEIDKYAIQLTQKNWPDTIQVGDVKNVWARNLPKIDLLIGGSPCQDLSVAKQNREGLKGARSGLFWHFVRLLRTMKPRWWMLENVASMSRADRDKITEVLGVEPILINSALVSAQQRKRLYWTNIPGVTQPDDRGILLKDVLENSEDGLLYNPYGEKVITGKSRALCVGSGKELNRAGQLVVSLYRGAVQTEKAQSVGTTGNMTSKMAQVVVAPVKLGYLCGKDYQQNRVYSVRGKSVSLNGNGGGRLCKIDLPDGDYTIRKLTPTECERLQTLPDGYTEGVSNTQRYKMLGNGWTADVIAHIFSFIPKEVK